MDDIQVIVNGVPLTSFLSVEVKRTLVALSGTFTITSVDTSPNPFPAVVNDSIIITINGFPVINGFIEQLAVSYDDKDHSIILRGRDKTCDLIDSRIVKPRTYGSVAFKTVIEDCLTDLGITTISVTDTTNTICNGIQSAKIGDTYFSFLDTIAKSEQVILTTDGNGNILITRASKIPINTVLLHELNNPNNNVSSANMKLDFVNRFNKYTFVSQGSSIDPSTFTDTASIASQQSTVQTDSTIRPTRQFAEIETKSTADENLTQRAIWECNLRRAKSITYSAKVVSVNAEQDGTIWVPNLLVKVIDPYTDFSNTNQALLLIDVSYHFSKDGFTTDLSLVVADAFTLQADLDSNKKTKSKGAGLAPSLFS